MPASKSAHLSTPPSEASDDCPNDATFPGECCSYSTDANGRVKKRTKTGCMTCRKRRVKCGEEKPKCSNCVKLKKQCEYGCKTSKKDATDMAPEASDPCYLVDNFDMLSAKFQSAPFDSWDEDSLCIDESQPAISTQPAWPSYPLPTRSTRPDARCMPVDQYPSFKALPPRSQRGSQAYENLPAHGCICQQLRQMLLGTPMTPDSSALSTPDPLMMPSPVSPDLEMRDYFSTFSRTVDMGDFTPESLNSHCHRTNHTIPAPFQAKMPNMAEFEEFLRFRNSQYRANMGDSWLN